MIWTTLHPFLCPDKTHIEPMLRHMQSARVERVIFSVPWRATQVHPNMPLNLTPVQLWMQAAQRIGVPFALHVGPVFAGGWPSWGWPDAILALSPHDQKQAIIHWWRSIRAQLDPPSVVLSFGGAFDADLQEELRAFWHPIPVEDVGSWHLLDVRDVEWGEWEFDTLWWTSVDGISPGASVRVWGWWLGQGERPYPLPTAETVHEALNGPFVRTLIVSLWARGVSSLWWDPARGGVLPGLAPVPSWGTTLDGGAPFRSWGEPTSTWRALKRTSLQGHALRVVEMDWSPRASVQVQGDVEVLGWGRGPRGNVLAIRRLTRGESRVIFGLGEGMPRVEARLNGPDAWLLPVQWPILGGRGTVEIATGDVVWTQRDDKGELWLFDVTKGAEWVLRLSGEVVYETGSALSRLSDSLWHVVFEPGQQGQVIWQVGAQRFHLVAVDDVLAHSIWPPTPERPYLMLGPSQVLDVTGTPEKRVLQVSTDRPIGLLFIHRHPLVVEVVESQKRAVWGRRAGMGGVRLGGPKEWGAPRVRLPELEWVSQPWDGPLAPGGWEAISTTSRGLAAGWHWFQRVVPPSVQEVEFSVQGICDIWLGGERVAGFRSLDRPRTRAVRLPKRQAPMPLTLLVWVPPSDPEDPARYAGSITLPDVDVVPGAWRYRRGVCGVEEAGHRFRALDRCGADSGAAAFWLHQARFYLELPDNVWVQIGLPLGEVGEWVWAFLNGVMVGQWWSGWSRELALWLPPDVLRYHDLNELVLLHWPRGRTRELPPLSLQQICRERVWHVRVRS